MQLKKIPEDFIVEEVPLLEKNDGRWTYFWMKKKDYTTPKAIETIARALHAQPKDFQVAGNKDRQAITTQLCSTLLPQSALEKVKLDNIELTIIGKGNRPISLGMLKGNTFTITVRDIKTLPEKRTRFVNFFGEQRFLDNNIDVGRAMVKKEWETVATLLNLSTTNPINELQQYNQRMLKFYIHAFQSHLWNETVKKLLLRKKEKDVVPIIGFGTHVQDKDVRDITDELLAQENITTRDFIIRELPSLSEEGTERSMFVEAEHLEMGKIEKNELGEENKVTLSFFLPKGCYATVFLGQLFSHQQQPQK